MRRRFIFASIMVMVMGWTGSACDCFAQIDITSKVVTNDDESCQCSLGKPYFDEQKEYAPILYAPKPDRDFVIWKSVKAEDVFISGNSYKFVIYNWERNGSALIVYRKSKDTYVRSGGYAYLFGGNGSEIRIEKWSIKGKIVEITIDCIGHLHNSPSDEEHERESHEKKILRFRMDKIK